MTQMPLPRYAQVYMLDAPSEIDRPFTYDIPIDLRADIRVGAFVVVPFGRSNRRQFALVTALPESIPEQMENITKPILSLLYRELALSEEMLKLCVFLRDYTLCTMGDAVRAVVPTAAFGRLNEYYRVIGDLPPGSRYSKRELQIYQFLRLHERLPLSRLRSEFEPDVVEKLRHLCRSGAVEQEIVLLQTNEPQKTVYSIADPEEALAFAAKSTTGTRQRAILNALMGSDEMTDEEIWDAVGGKCRASLRALIQRGLLSCKQQSYYRDPYAAWPQTPPDDNILSAAQERALQQILTLYRTGEPKAALLHGVTGSGKTRVIKAAMDAVLASGKQIILLIPEISLTPQTVGYFRACYGERVAVIHSSLSNGERFDMWRKIRRGEVDICIGTRSAIFAPFDRIGLIVIDEEQEHTYKSDMSPRYHARDVARFRCAYHHAMMLLASATPSIESYYKAKSGTYTLIPLTERYGNAVLPEVTVADLRRDARNGHLTPIGSVLRDKIDRTLQSGEQSILFLNRRGFHQYLACPSCGEVLMCPHCSVSLTYHTAARRNTHEATGYLTCHWCGHMQPAPAQCPSCGNPHLRYMGYGTQKAEEELQSIFPEARILRMDADTTGSKFSYHKILDAFRAGESDILLGTQMVTKGHDFPNVTLSGVIAADASLYLDDYRANERTFSMITQVLGRAGRGQKPGCAVIQTFNPDHPTIRMAAAQDYTAFYENEIALRRALLFPPFCDIVLLHMVSDIENDLFEGEKLILQFFRERLAEDFKDLVLQCFGPFEAPVYKYNEKYRMRMVIKCRLNALSRRFFRILLGEFSEGFVGHMTLSIDINPASL